MIKRSALMLAASALMAFAAQAATLKVVVVDLDGTPVEEAVVSVLPASGELPKGASGAPAFIRQEKNQYVPKVTLATPGTKLRFLNTDPWDHHIRATTGNQFGVDYTPLFQARQNATAEGKTAIPYEVSVDTAGVVLLGCHLHSSMTGYVYVSDSPWSAKTGADGVAILDNLPAGEMKVTLWQANEIRVIPVKLVTLNSTVTTLNHQLSVRVRKRKI
jgi:plastocyanin